MGVPLLVALLGDAAAGPVIGAIVIDLIVTSTLCLALAQARAARRSAGDDRARACACGAVAAARRADQSAALGDRRSAPSSAALGLEPPAPVGADRAHARRLGDAGGAVHDRRRAASAPAATSTRERRSRRYLPVALIKLLVHPALVFGLGLAARALGVPVPTFGLMVLTLTAALPSASNVSVLAERYGADNGRVRGSSWPRPSSRSSPSRRWPGVRVRVNP